MLSAHSTTGAGNPGPMAVKWFAVLSHEHPYEIRSFPSRTPLTAHPVTIPRFTTAPIIARAFVPEMGLDEKLPHERAEAFSSTPCSGG